MTNEITILKQSEERANEKGLEVCLREEAVRDQAKNARELFTSLQTELDELDDLKDGLSYLDMKNDTLLSYMIDLCNIVLRKVRGDTISGHASVERTVTYRVILEKIKSIDQRLAYQLNKVITRPEGADEDDQGVNIKNLDIDIGSNDEDDADDDGEEDEEAHKSRVSAKKSQSRRDHQEADDSDEDEESSDDDDEVDDEDSEFDGSVDEDDDNDNGDQDDAELLDESDDEPRKPTRADSRHASRASNSAGGGGGKKPVGVYKPPKLRSVAYNDEREGKSVSGKRRRDYSDIYQDDDGNQDIVDESYVERDNERTRYEEENYTRLPDMNPKKAKRKAKEMAAAKGKKKFKGGASRGGGGGRGGGRGGSGGGGRRRGGRR